MKKINFDPDQTIAVNAQNNDVSPSTISYYLHANGISPRAYKMKVMHAKVRACALENPGWSAAQIADKLCIAPLTARKYMHATEAPKPKSKKKESNVRAFLSVSDSQSQILEAIIAMHLEAGKSTFDCDLTAGELGFYKSIPRPEYLYDINPIHDGVNPLEETNDMCDVFDSVVVDLPVTISTTEKDVDTMTEFKDEVEMAKAHDDMLERAFRLLKSGGILVYKTMDYLYKGANRWTSESVLFKAREKHFKLKDKFIYIEPKENLRRRKKAPGASILAHSYFYVFRKP